MTVLQRQNHYHFNTSIWHSLSYRKILQHTIWFFMYMHFFVGPWFMCNLLLNYENLCTVKPHLSGPRLSRLLTSPVTCLGTNYDCIELTYPDIKFSRQSAWEWMCPDKWGSTVRARISKIRKQYLRKYKRISNNNEECLSTSDGNIKSLWIIQKSQRMSFVKLYQVLIWAHLWKQSIF